MNNCLQNIHLKFHNAAKLKNMFVILLIHFWAATTEASTGAISCAHIFEDTSMVIPNSLQFNENERHQLNEFTLRTTRNLREASSLISDELSFKLLQRLSFIMNKNIALIVSSSNKVIWKNFDSLASKLNWKRRINLGSNERGAHLFKIKYNRYLELRKRASTSLLHDLNRPDYISKSSATIFFEDAIQYIENGVKSGKRPDLHELLEIHKILANGPNHYFMKIGGILRSGSGFAIHNDRGENLYIQGRHVEKALEDFNDWFLQNRDELHPIQVATITYQWLVSIHPFLDGNGRAIRLFVDWYLQDKGFPPLAMSIKQAFGFAVFVAQENSWLTGNIKLQSTINAMNETFKFFGEYIQE